MPRVRSRSYCFTINNYTEEHIVHLGELAIECEYLVYGKEIAPTTGTPHLQGYIHFKNQKELTAVIKKIPGHVEPAKGNTQQNRDYCIKGGDYTEYGTMPKQGKRTDIEEIAENIREGRTTAEGVALSNPLMYHKYGRTLHKVEDIILRTKYRSEMTRGIWYWGTTGAGKSHIAHEGYNPATHYVWKNDNGWQDGYTGQETVIINDFRGEIPYNEMLQMVDKWPYFIRRRGREPAPFLAKLVIVTSSLQPAHVYKNRVIEDSIEQLLRRFEIVHLSQKYSEGNNEPLSTPPRNEENIPETANWDAARPLGL